MESPFKVARITPLDESDDEEMVLSSADANLYVLPMVLKCFPENSETAVSEIIVSYLVDDIFLQSKEGKLIGIQRPYAQISELLRDTSSKLVSQSSL
jgi:hypothetical protein